MNSRNRRPMPTWDEIGNTIRPGSGAEHWLNTLMNDSSSDGSVQPDPNFEVEELSKPVNMSATSSSKPERPRTLRAGYDYQGERMVVVFRDGTWYEYKNVSVEMWQSFQSAPSKSPLLDSTTFTSLDRGAISPSTMSRAQRVQMSNTQDYANYMYSDNKNNDDNMLGYGSYSRPSGTIF